MPRAQNQGHGLAGQLWLGVTAGRGLGGVPGSGAGQRVPRCGTQHPRRAALGAGFGGAHSGMEETQRQWNPIRRETETRRVRYPLCVCLWKR